MTNAKMKAIVLTRYGGPSRLKLQTVARPTVKEHQILVRIKASTVTKADTMMRTATPFVSRFLLGLFKPKHPITGTGFAGVVVETGKAVQHFKTGDEVFGETGTTFGANAEYVATDADGVILHKPKHLSYEEAATFTDGPLTSYNFLKNLGQIQPGQRVLINGASGSLGTAAVQLARHFGAHVTAVCSSRNEALVRQLGADDVIDYTKTQPTNSAQQWDLIYDTVGKLDFRACRQILSPTGIYLSPVLGARLLWQMLRTRNSKGQKAVFAATGMQQAEQLKRFLNILQQLHEIGALSVIIDKRYPLEQTVAAHSYADTGRKRGNLVIIG